MEEQKQTTPENTGPKLNTGTESPADGSSSNKIVLIIASVILILAGLVYLFIRLGPETTASIRDIMLIIFALESVVTVAAVTVLCLNLAKLVNFLKYEVQPILNTTGRTVRKLSGTVSFLCDNAVEPTVNAASTISGIKNAFAGVLAVFKK